MNQQFSWPMGMRDMTEFPKVEVRVDVSFREHLAAFCKMDGLGWNDYDEQRSVGNLAVANSRIRTFRKMYEKLGLIYRQDEKIRLSGLGRQLSRLDTELGVAAQKALDQLRKTAIEILSRYQLRNPVDAPNLPKSCDVLPCVCIWQAMRALDNKINFEEMNRVILHIMHMSELDEAIGIIKEARARYGNYANVEAGLLDSVLGERVTTDQPGARILPWFSFAGWGGLVIAQNLDADGYRRLHAESAPLLDDVLTNPPTYFEALDKQDWLDYYIGSSREANDAAASSETDVPDAVAEGGVMVKRAPRTNPLWPLNQILYGAPGTGKTYATAEIAVAIIEKRPIDLVPQTAEQRRALMKRYNRYFEKGLIAFTTFHQSYGYEEFVQGIRPLPSADVIGFRVTDGVLKTICVP